MSCCIPLVGTISHSGLGSLFTPNNDTGNPIMNPIATPSPVLYHKDKKQNERWLLDITGQIGLDTTEGDWEFLYFESEGNSDRGVGVGADRGYLFFPNNTGDTKFTYIPIGNYSVSNSDIVNGSTPSGRKDFYKQDKDSVYFDTEDDYWATLLTRDYISSLGLSTDEFFLVLLRPYAASYGTTTFLNTGSMVESNYRMYIPPNNGLWNPDPSFHIHIGSRSNEDSPLWSISHYKSQPNNRKLELVSRQNFGTSSQHSSDVYNGFPILKSYLSTLL